MPSPLFYEHFTILKDPRVKRAQHHNFLEVLLIALLAVLCHAEGWEDMKQFGEARITWLRERLGLTLENGIPCGDTFRRIFNAIDPVALRECFTRWVEAIRTHTDGEVIALDGKTIRHSFDTALGQKALHVVRAWATEQRLILGAVPVDDKSNEIPALTTLLSLLDVRGAIVTADAMHCQKRTTEQVVQQEGDYILAVKDNQPRLLEDITNRFEYLDSNPESGDLWQSEAPGRSTSSDITNDYGHGREEERSVTVLTLADKDPDWLGACPRITCGLRLY